MAALRGRLPRVSALDRVSGLFRVFRSSGKGFPGGPLGAPKDQLPRELNGRKCGARAWVPLVLPFFARGTCRRCAQDPWQRLLQKAERLLRGSRSLPKAPRALVSQMPRLLAVVRREPAVLARTAPGSPALLSPAWVTRGPRGVAGSRSLRTSLGSRYGAVPMQHSRQCC